MASVLPSVIDESLFQCRLCCRSTTDPRLLPCLHVFCRTCLLRHVARLRYTAIAQQQSAVAQEEPEDQVSSLVSGDKFPLSAAANQRDRGVEDGLTAGSEGRPPRTATGPALPTSAMKVDEFAYEVPRTDDYEDVDNDRMYADDVTVRGSHVVVANELGYALMANKPVASAASSSPQV